VNRSVIFMLSLATESCEKCVGVWVGADFIINSFLPQSIALNIPSLTPVWTHTDYSSSHTKTQ